MHNGTVFSTFTRCASCGREAAYNMRTGHCTVTSCALYFATTRVSTTGVDDEQVEGGDFAV